MWVCFVQCQKVGHKKCDSFPKFFYLVETFCDRVILDQVPKLNRFVRVFVLVFMCVFSKKASSRNHVFGGSLFWGRAVEWHGMHEWTWVLVLIFVFVTMEICDKNKF